MAWYNEPKRFAQGMIRRPIKKKRIPLNKKVVYNGKAYIIADYFRGKYKLLRAGEPVKWVCPRSIGMKKLY